MLDDDMLNETDFADLDDLPGYAMRRAHNRMMAALGEALGPLGLRVSDVTVMKLVDESSGATSSQISRALDISRANIVPVLKRLEEAGFAQRRALDGKSQAIVLTDQGKAALAEAWDTIRAVETEFLLRVPEAHRAHLLPALRAMNVAE